MAKYRLRIVSLSGQADPIEGLIIVVFLIREGYETLSGEDSDTDRSVPKKQITS